MLLTLGYDKLGIKSIVDKVIEDNPIDIYTDYRDFEYVEEMVDKHTTKEIFEDAIMDSYDQYVVESQMGTVSIIEEELHKHYEFDHLSDELNEYIYNTLCEKQVVNYPFEEFLSQKLKLDIVVTYNHSEDVFSYPFDYTTLRKVLSKLGYIHPGTVLKECTENKYDEKDKFLKSLNREMRNSYSDHLNYLTFLCTLSVEEYYELKNNPRNCFLSFDKNTDCGFFDPYNGGGSVLGIELQQVLTIRGDVVKMILLEGGSNKYTVNDVYGLSSDCWKPISFTKGSSKKIYKH